jgi:hypothetical protein
MVHGARYEARGTPKWWLGACIAVAGFFGARSNTPATGYCVLGTGGWECGVWSRGAEELFCCFCLRYEYSYTGLETRFAKVAISTPMYLPPEKASEASKPPRRLPRRGWVTLNPRRPPPRHSHPPPTLAVRGTRKTGHFNPCSSCCGEVRNTAVSPRARVDQA